MRKGSNLLGSEHLPKLATKITFWDLTTILMICYVSIAMAEWSPESGEVAQRFLSSLKLFNPGQQEIQLSHFERLQPADLTRGACIGVLYCMKASSMSISKQAEHLIVHIPAL